MATTTATFISLVEHRIVGLLHAVLSHERASADKYDRALIGSQDESGFYDQAGPLLLEVIENSGLPQQFYDSLAQSLDEMIGTEILDRLVVESRYALTNFGVFTRDRAVGNLTVSFQPDLVLDERVLPTSSLDIRDRLHKIAGKLTSNVLKSTTLNYPDPLKSPLQEPERFQGAVPFIASALMRQTIPGILRRFATDRSVVAAAKSSRSRPSGKNPKNAVRNWFTIMAVPPAMCGYCCWVMAFAKTLRNISEVRLDGVGRFQLTQTTAAGNRISFAADERFLNLLNANLPPAPVSQPRVPDSPKRRTESQSVKRPAKKTPTAEKKAA